DVSRPHRRRGRGGYAGRAYRRAHGRRRARNSGRHERRRRPRRQRGGESAMSTAVDEQPSGTSGNEELPEPQQPGIWRRIAHAYLYGNQVVVTFLAFICALVVGSILIAITDPATRTSLGYFFQHPSDTLHHGGHAIAAAYTALFRGAIL